MVGLALFDHFLRKLRGFLCWAVSYDAVGSGYFGKGTDPTASGGQESTAPGVPTASDRGIFRQGVARRGRGAIFWPGVWPDGGRDAGFWRRVRPDAVGTPRFRKCSPPERAGALLCLRSVLSPMSRRTRCGILWRTFACRYRQRQVSVPHLYFKTVEKILIALQLIVAVGILNVWLLRSGKATPFRGGEARTLREEFAAYGLPFWFMCAIGVLKVGLAISLIAAIWIHGVAQPAAIGLGALMLGAFVMHLKVKDPMKKALPSIAVLAMCAAIAFLG